MTKRARADSVCASITGKKVRLTEPPLSVAHLHEADLAIFISYWKETKEYGKMKGIDFNRIVADSTDASFEDVKAHYRKVTHKSGTRHQQNNDIVQRASGGRFQNRQ